MFHQGLMNRLHKGVLGMKDQRIHVTHATLVEKADRWLRQRGCSVTLRDPFRASVQSGEMPDAIGWRDGISILVECKVSRADFLADAKKPFRRKPETGMGDWRFYLSPPGVIEVEDLAPGWGLLWFSHRRIDHVFGVPANTQWWTRFPFVACKRSETVMLASQIRRRYTGSSAGYR